METFLILKLNIFLHDQGDLYVLPNQNNTDIFNYTFTIVVLPWSSRGIRQSCRRSPPNVVGNPGGEALSFL